MTTEAEFVKRLIKANEEVRVTIERYTAAMAGLLATSVEREDGRRAECGGGYLVFGAPGSATNGHREGDKVTVVPLAEPIPPADRHAILAELTRDETAEGMRADGFPPAATVSANGDQPAKPACGFGGCARPIDHPGEHATSTTLEDWARNRPAAASFASGGVITADQVRRMAAPVLDAINRPAAAASGLGDALRALMDDADPFWVAEKLADLAALADALTAERDRLADERDTLRAALDQERRSMANRLAVLERIKGERDVARAAVGRVRAWATYLASLDQPGDRWTAQQVLAVLDGGESQPCDSGAGAEGSRTHETGARADEQGGFGTSGGSEAAGAAEGDSRRCWRGCWCRGQR